MAMTKIPEWKTLKCYSLSTPKGLAGTRDSVAVLGFTVGIQCSQHVIHCLLQIEAGDEIFSHASRFTLGQMDQPTFWFVRRPGKSVGSATSTSNLLLEDKGRLICRYFFDVGCGRQYLALRYWTPPRKYHAQSRANVLPTGSVSTAATG